MFFMKKISITLLFFYSAIFFLPNTYSQSIKTDYGVYPEPAPPALPSAGGTFTDAVFGTTLLRVTDANDGTDNHQSYSYWPSFNKNSSLLYISSVGGIPMLYNFDTTLFSISNKRPLFQSNPAGDGTPGAEDAIWSGTQKDVMLCHTAQKIYRYNISTNQYTLIHDFSASYPDLYLWQMSRSINDTVFAFTYKENINYTVKGYLTYRIPGNQSDTANLPGMDEVQLDKTGNYLVIKTGNSGPSVIEVKILNLQTHNVENLTDNAPDFAPGHSDNGTGFVIGNDNWNNRYTFRTLSSPHQFYSVVDFNNDWSLGTHVSMLCDDETWLLISTFVANTLTSSGIFVDEIFQVATDGSKSVRRLAHTHSDYLNQNPNNTYWSMPKANISRDGKYAVFTSNWGSTLRRDVFVLKIPPASPLGVTEAANSSFGLFPNPTNGMFTIQSSEGSIQSLEIYSVFGDKVFSLPCPVNDEQLTINLSSFPAGMYFVKATTPLGSSVQKISYVR
jgi:hypothetical protein